MAGLGAGATVLVGTVAWWLAGPTGAVVGVGLWGPILAGLLLELARAQWEDAEMLSTQDRALTNLVVALGPRIPLPPTRGWAASPDLLCYLTQHILTDRPGSVVELGSGTSTVCLGYALERAGSGRLMAVDHDEGFSAKTSSAVRAHGLSDRVQVVHAPLVETGLTDVRTPWYDLGGLDLPPRIDLLFVDGPPAQTGPMARYPALPLLRKRLGPTSLVVMDDGFRPPERAIVDAWRAEFNPSRVELLSHLEKGAWVMTGFGAA